MKKVMSPILQKEYWIADQEAPPVEGLPVYSKKEIELLKKVQQKLTKKELEDIYMIKLTTGSTLFKIFDDGLPQEKENFTDQYKKPDGVSPVNQNYLENIKQILGGKKNG
jgi:hypothetical protein